jgi:hypothetical protein
MKPNTIAPTLLSFNGGTLKQVQSVGPVFQSACDEDGTTPSISGTWRLKGLPCRYVIMPRQKLSQSSTAQPSGAGWDSRKLRSSKSSPYLHAWNPCP